MRTVDIVLAFPILTGLVLRALFDRFSAGAAASVSEIAWLLVLLVALDIVRQAIFWLAIATWPYWWNSVETLLRANLLRSILCAPGAASRRLPASSGEALNRFRDDVEDLLLLTDIWIDVAGDAVFAAIVITRSVRRGAVTAHGARASGASAPLLCSSSPSVGGLI